MKTYLGWIIIVCFFAALVGGFFMLKKDTSGTPPDVSFATTTANEEGLASLKTGEPASIAPSLPAPNVPDGFKEYRNDQFGLSFYYPQGFSPQEFIDHGPELTVVFQGGAGQPGFQVYAAPIDGTKVSAGRFQQDEPSGIMQNPHDTSIDGAQGISFDGFDAKMGKTHEVWFIHSAHGIPFLYEVSTYKELSGWLSEIMQTWRFTQ